MDYSRMQAPSEENEEEDDSKQRCLRSVLYPWLLQTALVFLLTGAISGTVWQQRQQLDLLTKEAVKMVRYLVFWELLALVAAAVASINALIHSLQHFLYSDATKDLHKCCQVIIWVVPVYAICSAVAFVAEVSKTHFSVLLNTVRESYEAVVLVFFMMFVAEYLGGVAELAKKVATEEIVVRKVLPERVQEKLEGYSIFGFPVLDLRLFPFRRAPGSEYTFWTFFGVLQYAVVIMLVLVFHWTVWAHWTRVGDEVPEWVEMVEQGMKGLKLGSSGWALYNLLVLYEYLIEAAHTKESMEKINPHSKFWCIKLIVMFSLYQENILKICANAGLLPTMLGWHVVWRSDSSEGQKILADGAVNFFVCIEMLLFAQWHRFAYPYKEDLLATAEADFEDDTGVRSMFRELGILRKKAKASRAAIRVLREAKDNTYSNDMAEADLKAAFDAFDKYCDEQIPTAQLIVLLTDGEGLNLEEARGLITAADVDGDGYLSWDEFRAACRKRLRTTA